jgi:hypothetical protein
MRSTISRMNLAMLSIALVFVPFAACSQDVKGPMHQQLEYALESFTGSIDVHGRVVDENGIPLNGVTVKYFFRDLGEILSEERIEYRYLTVDGDGRFRIRQKDVSSVRLTFFKEGYYANSWSFGFDPEKPSQSPREVEKFDIEIVLEKQPISAPLKKFEGILRTDSIGPVSVVEVKRMGSGETWLRKKDTRKELPWPYVFLAAGEADGLELPISEFTFRGKRRRLGLREGSIQLENCGEGDGFIMRSGVQAPPSRDEIGLRQLLEAPESGYSSRLEVAATDDNPETIYFYCKANGQYGKGMVSGRPIIAEEDGREVARAAILIYLNPTGSRDVAYLHY